MSIVKKVFSVTIPERDLAGFAADLDGNLMAALRGVFEGHTYQGAAIIQILKVTERSPVRAAGATNVIDVQFLAEAFVTNPRDLLKGVRIVVAAPPSDDAGGASGTSGAN